MAKVTSELVNSLKGNFICCFSNPSKDPQKKTLLLTVKANSHKLLKKFPTDSPLSFPQVCPTDSYDRKRKLNIEL